MFTRYYWNSQIKENESAGHVARMTEMRNTYSILVGIPERKIPLWRNKLRREDNIKSETGCVGLDWML